MERSLGLDVDAASCTLAVASQTGKRLRDLPVATNGQALVEAIRGSDGSSLSDCGLRLQPPAFRTEQGMEL